MDNEPERWHVIGKSPKGEFQWIIDSDGAFVDCPYYLRGYWLGRKVNLDLLLSKSNPSIIVTCDMTGHQDEIKTETLTVTPTELTVLPEYVLDQPYTGGLYDIRQKHGTT